MACGGTRVWFDTQIPAWLIRLAAYRCLEVDMRKGPHPRHQGIRATPDAQAHASHSLHIHLAELPTPARSTPADPAQSSSPMLRKLRPVSGTEASSQDSEGKRPLLPWFCPASPSGACLCAAAWIFPVQHAARAQSRLCMPRTIISRSDQRGGYTLPSEPTKPAVSCCRAQ